MSVQINKAHIYGINDGTDPGEITLYNPDASTLVVTGYVSPKLSSLNLTHESASEEITDQFGEVDQLFYWREKFSMTLEVIPRASALTDRVKAAAIPAAGGVCTIAKMMIIEAGSLVDVLNGSKAWVYPGGASWNFVDEGRMSLSLPLVRYPGITEPSEVS